MKALFAATLCVAVLFAAGAAGARTTPVFDRADFNTPGDSDPNASLPAAAGSVACGGDTWCSDFTVAGGGFIADGEWNPVSGYNGFICTSNEVVITDAACAILSVFTTSVTNAVQRGFCWGVNPAAGDFWTGSWIVAGAGPAAIRHYDATGLQIGADYTFTDPATNANMQCSGLAMDYPRGHMWAILRNNNPNGAVPVSRFVEFDVNSGTPVLIQGPIDVPWNGGPSTISSSGLEYNNRDCTIVANRQDANNVGIDELTVFQDNNPGGAGGVTFLGFCQIVNQPCTGAGQTTNRPWGIALVEGATPYVIFSDLNLPGPPCGTAPAQPGDFHFVNLPGVNGSCGQTAVEPSTWGSIKNTYRGR